MKITSKGQVTIPIGLRERTGLLPGTEVEFLIDDDGVRLVRANGKPGRGAEMVARMRGTATAGLSTDEILALTRG